MTTLDTSITRPAGAAVHPRFAKGRPVADSLAVAWRNITALRRIPQFLVFSTIQPVIFVLMFRYVFGGAISTPGRIPYVDYLMPGIFVQTVTFGAIATAVGLATDMQTGLLERFRSLPMARSAVLAGRTLADLMRNVFVALLMLIVGVGVGFRYHTHWYMLFPAIGLMLMFGYTLSWVFASVGLSTGDPETAQAAAFPVMAPLVFASSAFVSVKSMPGWLQPFAAHQPVSVTASAIRGMLIGHVPGTASTAWYTVQAVAWIAGILLVFAPLAVRKYRNAV